MSAITTTIVHAAQVGLPILFSQENRGFQDILLPDGTTMENFIAQATIEERHIDEMDICEHPIEQGAAITDHAYKLPAKLILRLGWSNSKSDSNLLDIAASWIGAVGGQAGEIVSEAYGLVTAGLNLINSEDYVKKIYDNLQLLQTKRAIFSIYTPKRVYYNMMCRGLHTETDWTSANSLPILMDCQEVILTKRIDPLSAEQLKNPASNAAPINNGTKQLIQK